MAVYGHPISENDMTESIQPADLTDEVELIDRQPDIASVLDEVLAGLTATPKTLPPKLLYDEVGARLFEDICEVDEYYVTRTELAIMSDHVGEMAACFGADCLLIEYGSGASVKVRQLLEHLDKPAGYVPVEIAKEQLVETANAISRDFPELTVTPVCADFTETVSLPEGVPPAARRVVYFPGSTIGNFHPQAACAFLKKIARVCGKGGGLLIGVDLLKPTDVLLPAYNDAAGVTAAFNLNLLHRLNRELDADFDVDAFAHKAVFNEDKRRIEMHLVSSKAQSVRLNGQTISFRAGETIHTECSYKYTLDTFRSLAAEAGWDVQKTWLDANRYFSIQYLTVQ
jgi:dimethylhistidine N-methyltransferase